VCPPRGTHPSYPGKTPERLELTGQGMAVKGVSGRWGDSARHSEWDMFGLNCDAEQIPDIDRLFGSWYSPRGRASDRRRPRLPRLKDGRGPRVGTDAGVPG